MKTHGFLRTAVFTALSLLLFASCDQTEPIAVSDLAVSARTPMPQVPAILQVPAGNVVSFHTYAQGTQIYTCMETAPGEYGWVFNAPAATLYSNAGFNGVVGSHYGGPTWESNSGSKVKAARLQGMSVNSTAVPWLLLETVSTEGHGVFQGTTFIQRINTTGGLAPADGANAGTVGQQIGVPYTAEYYFYKAE